MNRLQRVPATATSNGRTSQQSQQKYDCAFGVRGFIGHSRPFVPGTSAKKFWKNEAAAIRYQPDDSCEASTVLLL